MNKDEILNEYYLDARTNLLDLAAFIDRLERADGTSDDYRIASLTACIHILNDLSRDKTRRILECLSDPSSLPVESSSGKAATGAWSEFTKLS